jgi:hypothetical protein
MFFAALVAVFTQLYLWERSEEDATRILTQNTARGFLVCLEASTALWLEEFSIRLVGHV